MIAVDDESFVSIESLVEEAQVMLRSNFSYKKNTALLSSSVIKEFPSSFSDSDDLIMEVEALSSFPCSLFFIPTASFVSIDLCYFKIMYPLYAIDGELGPRDAGSRERSPSKEPKAVSDLHPFSVYGSVNPPHVGELVYVQQRHCLCKSISRIGYDMIEWLMERLSIDDSGKLSAFIVYILNVSLHNSYTLFASYFSWNRNSGSDSHRQSFVSAWLLLSCWRVQEPCCQG